MKIILLLAFSFLSLYAQEQKNLHEYALPNFQKEKAILPHVSVRFSQSKQKKVKFLQKDIVVSKTTHHLFKDSQETCKQLLLSALKDMQSQAIKLRSSKIINIVGYIDNQTFNSNKKFQCKVGKVFTTITLKADIIQ